MINGLDVGLGSATVDVALEVSSVDENVDKVTITGVCVTDELSASVKSPLPVSDMLDDTNNRVVSVDCSVVDSSENVVDDSGIVMFSSISLKFVATENGEMV